MTYDTTLLDTVDSSATTEELPACLKRNNLSPEYFPATSRAQLGMIICLCVLFAWTSFHRLNHTDLWGHVQFGRWIAQHHALPAIDPFSSEPVARPIVHSAWLSQLIGYETARLFGPEGLVLGHALLATLGCGIMMLAIHRRNVPLCWAVAGGVAYYVLLLPIVGTIRPQLFGMVGAPLVLLALACLPAKRHPLYWLPITFLLWANLHGSFVMGLIMLGIGCVGTTWRLFGENGGLRKTVMDYRVMRMWSALGLAVLGASFNPQGPQLMTTVLAFGQHTALANISEWRTLALASMSGVLFWTSVALLAVALWRSPRRWETTDVLLILAFGLVTPTAMRMLAWWAAIWPFVIVPYVVAWWQARVGERDEAPATPMRTVVALGFIFMTLLTAPPTNNLVLGRARGIGAVAGKDTPIYVADEIARRKLQGAFFAPMDWADYLIWTQPDGFRPLVYSHVHLLAPEVWNDHQRIAVASEDWLALADKHQLRYLVVSRERNKQLAIEATKLARKPNSRATVLYQDQKSLLVELRPAPAALAAK